MEKQFRVLLAVVAVGGCGPGVNADVAASCRDGRLNPTGILQTWKERGVVRGERQGERGTTFVEVATAAWSKIEYADQIRIGVASYCVAADASGRGTAVIKGTRQETLGAVVNGHWSR
ncbi:hypothetical protein [Aminobacter aminovorans]|uniref:hypothetical protein n=1 Tax=Aminobacter aminovorans TaxID=83263 RepID=UPI0028620A29|nr:hypothetical protein [Aminobacter aminovorans]MDR7220330.1 hypothetical protein [Aminobacter aminovorans]